MKLVLLPGMDGTGDLFAPILERYASCEVVRYPPEEMLGYDQLLGRIVLPDEPFVLLAESFSGPLAIRLAAQRPEHFAGLVLVASFVRAPAPRWLTAVVGAWAFARPLPAWAIRRVLAGRDAPDALVAATIRAIRGVRPDVLAHRVREILAVDVRAALARVEVPVLALYGRSDVLVRRSARDDLVRCLVGIRVVELDAPHLVLQRRPDQVLAAVQQLLTTPIAGPVSGERRLDGASARARCE